MIGYRLHFERASLAAIELVRKGELGEPRLFTSLFPQDVQPGNLRLRKGEGGPLYDIGIYCLNAARALFGGEPEEVTGWHARGSDPRFAECPEATSALLRFPGERIASFSCSFAAPGTSSYEIVGSEATLRVSPAFSIGERLVHQLTRRGRTRTTSFPAGDQFAPELLYFSDCIREDHEPEPSGEEGLADVRVLEAIEASAATGRSVELAPFEREARPGLELHIRRPAHGKAPLVHVQDPSPD
jgi:glucose-fructose oxidoreductase